MISKYDVEGMSQSFNVLQSSKKVHKFKSGIAKKPAMYWKSNFIYISIKLKFEKKNIILHLKANLISQTWLTHTQVIGQSSC